MQKDELKQELKRELLYEFRELIAKEIDAKLTSDKLDSICGRLIFKLFENPKDTKWLSYGFSPIQIETFIAKFKGAVLKYAHEEICEITNTKTKEVLEADQFIIDVVQRINKSQLTS